VVEDEKLISQKIEKEKKMISEQYKTKQSVVADVVIDTNIQ
jgi:hypothetical protein